jgi:hypothetical protein
MKSLNYLKIPSMKKTLLSLLMVSILTGSTFAQGLYLRAGGGYGLPIAASSFGEKTSYTQIYDGTNNVYKSSTDLVTGSYGAGTNFNFAIGYKFNENFIFELSSQYLLSNAIKTFNNDVYKNTDPLNAYSDVDNFNSSTSAKAFLLNPSFIFSAGFGKAAPYGRFGVIVGSPKISGSSLSYYNGDGVDSTQKSWEFSKGMALGFQGAIGMNWKLSDKLDFYTELNFVSMTYYPGEYNLTKDLTWNGFDYYDNLANTSLRYKKTVYKKAFDPSTVNNDNAQPEVSLRESHPFSSFSLQVGVRYSLFKIAK